jgi:predicted acyl esterase
MKKILSFLFLFLASSISFAQNEASKKTTPYPGGLWEPGPANFGSVVVNDMPVTMDDGVVLMASISYPTDLASGERAPGKFPVIIEFTPYVSLGRPVVPNAFFTEHGYIYAIVRPCGTGTSGGEVEMFSSRDGLDGKTIVDWAAHQLDGSDGRVAFVGCSYPGGLALTTAAQLGPNSPVKAIVATCCGLNQVNRESFMQNGLLTTGFWSYISRGAGLWGNSPAAVRYIDWFKNEVVSGGDAAYDREYWHDRQPLRWAENIGVTEIPVLLWAGWQDIVEDGAAFSQPYKIPMQTGRFSMKQGQPTTPRYQIILGNWHTVVVHDAVIISG